MTSFWPNSALSYLFLGFLLLFPDAIEGTGSHLPFVIENENDGKDGKYGNEEIVHGTTEIGEEIGGEIQNSDVSTDSFTMKLMHRDHPSSNYKRDFRNNLEKFASYVADDRLRFEALKARQSGSLPDDLTDWDSPENSSDKVEEGPRKLLSSFKQNLYNGLTIFGQYYVDIYLGTPPVLQKVVFDTASNLLFVQCQCLRCSKQVDPYFSSSNSSTFAPIPCSAKICSEHEVQYSLGKPRCFENPKKGCPYRYIFGSGSSRGLLARDTLSLTKTTDSSYKLRNVVFGCGQKNKGLVFADGVLGVGRSPLSLPSQMKLSADAVFSTCLVPQTSKATSEVIFGNLATPRRGVTYTKLLVNENDFTNTNYYVQVVEVKVGGKIVAIPPSAFEFSPKKAGGGTLLDTSTTYGFLTRTAWNPIFAAVSTSLRGAATKASNQTEKGQNFSPCWLYSKALLFPVIEVLFEGGATLRWGPNNYLALLSPSVVCNVIQSSGEGGNVFGALLLQNNLILWDSQNGRIGFKPTDCSTVKPL